MNNTNNKFVLQISDISREIIKMVDRYQPEEVIDLICLQRDLNVLLSEAIVNHYNLTPEVLELAESKPSMNAIFSQAAKDMLDTFTPTPPEKAGYIDPIFHVVADGKYVDEQTEPVNEPSTEELLKEINTLFSNVTPFDEGFEEIVKGEVIPGPVALPRIGRPAEVIETVETTIIEEDKDNWIPDYELVGPPQEVTIMEAIPFVSNKFIFIVELFGTKWVVTEHQYNKQELMGKIIDRLDDEEWVTKYKTNIEANPELFDKLIKDKLKYEDFLTLEGWIDANDDFLDSPYKKMANELPPITKPDFKLTDHQQEKFDTLIEKINAVLLSQMQLVRPPNPAYFMTVLEGAAGTGKTTMMVKVLERLIEEGNNIIFCSPTHQALGVIRETLRENWLNFTESNEDYLLGDDKLIIKTLASFLGIKMKRDEENGTETFEEDPKAAILTCDILAIDESSMVSKDQLKIILRKLHINAKCILFIGDEVQLDSPSDNNESNGIFTLPQKFSLTEVVRQAADNKILQLAWEIRSYILSGNCSWLPSQLLTPERTNENIIILKDQPTFLQHYFDNESKSKLIATYTNKITNEYNDYVRQCRLIGTGKPLDIDIDGNGKNTITSWDELKEFYPGEELVALEPNTRNDDIIHQTGERFIIGKITSETKSVITTVQNDADMFGVPEQREFIINYWRIEDTNGKLIWVAKKEETEKLNEVLALLSIEAKKATGKFRWAKYFDIKGRFTRVNKTYAFTLHKLQGSTCEDIYVDARDLNKFWQRMNVGVYKLIYIALTRPKNRVIFLV